MRLTERIKDLNNKYPKIVFLTSIFLIISTISLFAAVLSGPNSVTTNAIPRFSNNKQLLNSGVLIDSSDNITGVNDLTVGGTLSVPGNTTMGNILVGDAIGNGSGLTNLNASNLASGTIPFARAGSITNHADVTITSLAAGNVLGYNGTVWTNGAPSSGGTSGAITNNESRNINFNGVVSNSAQILLFDGSGAAPAIAFKDRGNNDGFYYDSNIGLGFSFQGGGVFAVGNSGGVMAPGMSLAFSPNATFTSPDASIKRTAAGTISLATNLAASGTITATNGFLIPTNYTEANFAPITGMGRLVISNAVLYFVTSAKTNLVSDGRP